MAGETISLGFSDNPARYGFGEVKWTEKGDNDEYLHGLFLEKLRPFLADTENGVKERALDISLGQGWLVTEITSHGISALGIDPSLFKDFADNSSFDLITAAMVMEHLPTASETLEKMKSMLRQTGEILLIADFNKTRDDYVDVAKDVGLIVTDNIDIEAPDLLIEESPQGHISTDKPVFKLVRLIKQAPFTFTA